MKIMKTVITLLGSIHTPAMHTADFCHCVQLRAGAVLQSPALWLTFSHAFENWLRFFKGARVSLKKESTFQNDNISYGSSAWQTDFQ